jgi:uncharacterized protein (UPF0548 family)
MFSLRRPSELELTAFRLRQGRRAFSYPHPGCTRTETCPPGYVADHTRVGLGHGPGVFAAAREVLRSWGQFPAPWAVIAPPVPPVREGAVAVVLARVGGVWVRSAARVVYATDEPGRFGYAYGTLPGHVERGEERFLVEMLADGSVWYDLLAYSRPGHPLVRLGYPLARRLQRRFARDSAAAVRRAVAARPAATAPAAGYSESSCSPKL